MPLFVNLLVFIGVAAVLANAAYNTYFFKRIGNGASYQTIASSVKVFSNGDWIVAGQTQAQFGATPGPYTTDSNDLYLQKYSFSGTLLWTRFVSSGKSDANAVTAIDTSGNIYIAGICLASYDGRTYVGPNGDICIAKFDSAGNKLFSIQEAGGGTPLATDIGVDSVNQYFVVIGNIAPFGGIPGKLGGVYQPTGAADPSMLFV